MLSVRDFVEPKRRQLKRLHSADSFEGRREVLPSLRRQLGSRTLEIDEPTLAQALQFESNGHLREPRRLSQPPAPEPFQSDVVYQLKRRARFRQVLPPPEEILANRGCRRLSPSVVVGYVLPVT